MVMKIIYNIFFLVTGLCVFSCLSAENTTKLSLGDILEKHRDANDMEAFMKILLQALSQNGRFTIEGFDPSTNYGVYGFYLGVCNFKTNEYRYSAISFMTAISQLKIECPQMVGYGHLAAGNAYLMASISHPQVLGEAIKYYQNAASEKLSRGFGGLAIIYGLNSRREEALKNINRMLDADKSPQSLSIVLFCSLIIADKELFLSCVKNIDSKMAKEMPFAANNIAAGLMQFQLDRDETGYSKDALMADLLIGDREQKKYGIIDRRMETRKPYWELSEQERIVIPRIDIEYSIGWGPQKCTETAKKDTPKGQN
jgi:tetratricopeptide (TPR) repeat protein